MNVDHQYRLLVESLRLLSASYSKQKAYLPDFVTVQDEIVSIFDNAFLIVPRLLEEDIISKRAAASVIRCYNFMNLAVRNQLEVCDFENSELWAKTRQFATTTLIILGEGQQDPDLNLIDWVRSD